MNIRFVTDPNYNGWTLAVPDGVDPIVVAGRSSYGISLPWCLKVNLLKTEGGRDYFEILEGVHQHSKASLKLGPGGRSLLTGENPHRPPGRVHLNRRRQQLWYGSQGPFSAFTELNNPVPTGLHDLEIPDFPHPDYYPDVSKYQKVWFRIGHFGDRYLHLGTISHGCATVRPWIPDKLHDSRFFGRTNSELGLPVPNLASSLSNWDDICRSLMQCRKGDGRNVGSLVVQD